MINCVKHIQKKKKRKYVIKKYVWNIKKKNLTFGSVKALPAFKMLYSKYSLFFLDFQKKIYAYAYMYTRMFDTDKVVHLDKIIEAAATLTLPIT